MSLSMKAIFLITLLAASIAAQPSGYRIAFNSVVDAKADNYDVFSMKTDGTDIKNITGDKDVAWAYYASGDRLFFVSDRETCRRCYVLHSSNSTGGDVKKVTNLQLEDAWLGARNNGKELVVSGRVGKDVRFQLFIVETETGRFRKITDETAAAFRDPSFSPDGKKIIYVYKKDRTDRSEIEELYIMNADGTKKKKLTTYPAGDPLATDGSYKVGPPHWNARYDFITYQSNQAGKQSIYAVTPDGKKQWKLTKNNIDEGWHDWSPDGEWLAFDSRDDKTGRYDVYVMNYKTKEIKKITGDSPMKYHQSPVWVQTR